MLLRPLLFLLFLALQHAAGYGSTSEKTTTPIILLGFPVRGRWRVHVWVHRNGGLEVRCS